MIMRDLAYAQGLSKFGTGAVAFKTPAGRVKEAR